MSSPSAIPCLALDRAVIGQGLPGGVDAHDRTLLRAIRDPAGIANRGERDPGLVDAPGELNRRILTNHGIWHRSLRSDQGRWYK